MCICIVSKTFDSNCYSNFILRDTLNLQIQFIYLYYVMYLTKALNTTISSIDTKRVLVIVCKSNKHIC